MRLVRNLSFVLLVVLSVALSTRVVSAGCDVQIEGQSQLSEGYDPDDAMADCQAQADDCDAICISECGGSEMGGDYVGCDDWDPHPTYVGSTGTCYCEPEEI